MEGQELRQWRDRLGLTQGELGKLLSVDWGTVSRWERGTRQIPPYLPLALETLERRQPTSPQRP